ncbi:hypothetical protein FXO38_04223 [Capsicum annuum]|nr:hypothetical protein FXO38_04223 [Capsicum annuum]
MPKLHLKLLNNTHYRGDSERVVYFRAILSNAYNRGIVRGHYEHVNQMGHSFNTDRSDCKAKCVDHVYEKQSHHFQHSRQSNLHLYRNDLYDDTDKNHPIHDEEDDTPAPK